MERPKHTIQRLFLMNVLILVAVLLALQAVLNVSQIRNGMEQQVREKLCTQAEAIVGRINQRFSSFKLKAEGVALAATSLPHYEEKTLYSILSNHILSDTMIVGGGFWFAPHVYDPGKKFFCGYCDVDAEGTFRIEAGYTDGSYDYTRTEWYQSGMRSIHGASWYGPYRDEVTGVTMITSTCGLWKNGKVEGCVTLDIGLGEVEQYIHGIRVGESGYAFLLQQNGQMIGSGDKTKIPDRITDADYPGIAEIGREILASSELAVYEVDVYGTYAYIIAAPVNVEGIRLVLVAPKADYVGVIHRYIILTFAMVLIVTLALVFAIRSLFQHLIYRPIRELVAASDQIALGRVAEIHTEKRDELGYLAGSFQNMSKKLQERNFLLREQYHLLEDRNRALEEALANVESMRVSRDSYKMESETDKLTGLLNKASTRRKAEELLAQLPEGKLAALYILDLDHFKEANDTYGHQYGDLVLRGFAGELKRSFRPTDVLGRFGGDEFVVLLSHLPGREVVEKKAYHLLCVARNLQADGRNAGITASIGIALAPLQGSSYEELFQAADRCLYKVKEDGRDGYCIDREEPLHPQ